MSAAVTDAGGVRWDLTPLALSDDALRQRLASAGADAGSFVERWPPEAVAAIEPSGLAQLLNELGSLRAAREEGHWYVFRGLAPSSAPLPPLAGRGAGAGGA